MTTPSGEKLEWRAGWKPRGVAVEQAAAELERIHGRDGRLVPEKVLEEATPEGAPLHPVFPWDDAVAAHQHRLQIARTLIKSVRVVQPEGDSHPKYIAVKPPDVIPDGGRPRLIYRESSDVAKSEVEAASAIRLLTEKLHAAQLALDEFKALLGDGDNRVALVAAMSEALTTARELARSLK